MLLAQLRHDLSLGVGIRPSGAGRDQIGVVRRVPVGGQLVRPLLDLRRGQDPPSIFIAQEGDQGRGLVAERRGRYPSVDLSETVPVFVGNVHKVPEPRGEFDLEPNLG